MPYTHQSALSVNPVLEPEQSGDRSSDVQWLTVRRRDRRRGTLLSLAGEIDQDTAPQLDRAIQECLRVGIRTIDIDLADVTFCDIGGLYALLDATWLTTVTGGCLRLENLCPMLIRLLALTGTRSLLAIRGDRGARGRCPAGVRIEQGRRGRFLPAARSAGPPDDQ